MSEVRLIDDVAALMVRRIADALGVSNFVED